VSEANHDLILVLDKPVLLGEALHIRKYLFWISEVINTVWMNTFLGRVGA